MAPPYACEQPAGFKNHVEHVAIVGAGGRVGSHITRALVAQGKHRVTALTRPDSATELPPGLAGIRRVDYDDHAGLVRALTGQEALIITLPSAAPPEIQLRLVDAAAAAGVAYIMPNEYGTDHSHAALRRDIVIGEAAMDVRRHIERAGAAAAAAGGPRRPRWLALTSGFWYEFSLAGGEARYGFDLARKRVTLFDDGATRVCTTTWRQSGAAVAALFALPRLPADARDAARPTLARWHDAAVPVASFTLSQRDMLAAVRRVTGDAAAAWTVTHEDSGARYRRGLAAARAGHRADFILVLYSRVFFPGGGGDYSHMLVNDQLGLPQEDLDEATRVALQMHRDAEEA